jgi:hypothetical protein
MQTDRKYQAREGRLDVRVKEEMQQLWKPLVLRKGRNQNMSQEM